MVDVSKCSEHVPDRLLIDKAAQLGHPLALLRLSLRAYRWPRVITDGVAVAAPAFTRARGVIAGSAFALAELRALVHCEVLGVLVCVPRLALCRRRQRRR